MYITVAVSDSLSRRQAPSARKWTASQTVGSAVIGPFDAMAAMRGDLEIIAGREGHDLLPIRESAGRAEPASRITHSDSS